jgi:hypothetical protein
MGSYYVEDYDLILGWMSIDNNNQVKPLDQTTINAIIQLNGSSPNFICLNTGINHHFSISSYFFSCALSFHYDCNINFLK